MTNERTTGAGEAEVLHQGRYLKLLRRGTWEYIARANASGVVAIVAVNRNRELVLVEQHRAPIGRAVLELPAGLAGDHPGFEGESFEASARRELLEETGYAAERLVHVTGGPATAGSSDEHIEVFVALGARQVDQPTGDGTERITVRHAPLDALPAFLRHALTQGLAVDLKVWAAPIWWALAHE